MSVGSFGKYSAKNKQVYDTMDALNSQRGTVMYLSPTSYMALRYEGAAVIVPVDLVKREYLPDDIVEFDAKSISSKEQILYNSAGLKPKWMATKVKFVKHAEIIDGEGKILNIDPKGEYCFIEYLKNDTKYNIFCTRINVQPPTDSLNKVFSTGTKVRFVAKEQAPTLKSNVKWRTAVVTDMKHEIKPRHNGKIKSWEVVAPSSLPPPSMPPTPASNAAAAAVAPAPPPQPAPKPTTRAWTGASPPAAVAAPPASAPEPVQNNTSTTAQTAFPHPLPSYDWMKFDLVTVLKTSFPGHSSADEDSKQNQKVRAIAHQLSNNMCDFCLSH